MRQAFGPFFSLTDFISFSENLLKNRKMPIAFKIYWSLHNIALVIAFVVTIVYWKFLHKDGE